MSTEHKSPGARTRDAAGMAWRDPWRSVLGLSLMGNRISAIRNMELLSQRSPGQEHRDMFEIGARLMTLLGSTSMGLHMLYKAMEQGSSSTLGLAALLLADGPERVMPLLNDPRLSPEARADLACDVAARLFADGRVGEASRTVASGLEACLDHMELGRWRRFLAQGPLDIAVEAAARRFQGSPPRPASPQAGASSLDRGNTSTRIARAMEDVRNLIPTRSRAWFSEERLHRKLFSGVLDRPARTGSTLAYLQGIGAWRCRFAPKRDYEGASSKDAMVKLEIIAERLESMVSEGRQAVSTATDLWNRARQLPPPAAEISLQVLMELAENDRAIQPIARKAMKWLSKAHGTKLLQGAADDDSGVWLDLHRDILLALN